MFRSIGRFFRAIGYLLVGKVDAARQTLNTNPAVIQATFDRVIEEKKKRIHQYKDAVGGMIAQEERKKSMLKTLTEDTLRLRKLRDGAAAMARKVVERHQGDTEAVKADPDYIKAQAAFKDFGSTLAEKEARCVSLEQDMQELTKSIYGHKTQLESLLRELDRIKEEKHATVADMMTAQEEREIADMISGISKDRTSEELLELRESREQARATARVSREMAGVDTKRSEAEFMEYAAQTVSDDEFDALIGLSKEAEAPSAAEAPDTTRIPEA